MHSAAFTIWAKHLIACGTQDYCKLEHLGEWGKALNWLKDYLTTREQQVRVNGMPTPSSRLKIPAEVPPPPPPKAQSLAHSSSWVTPCSDRPEAVADVPGSSCEQFVDDTNLTSINSRADLTEDNLQVAINQTASCLRMWRLCVNPQKKPLKWKPPDVLHRHRSQSSLPKMHWPKCRVTDIWQSSSQTTSGGTVTLITYWPKQRACCRSFADCGHHWTKSPSRTYT